MASSIRIFLTGCAALAALVASASDFGVRAVQLDLARQKETVPFVKDFLRRVAAAGYDTAVLYLEDRVKTPGYPYSSDAESYSVAEMKEIVAVADGLKIDLVPVVSPLGHTDRFLRHAELQPFAETYRCPGRYGRGYRAFCLENPGARAWMEKYLGEVMAIFPGKNFHMGFDETDDLGFCARCKPIRERDGLGSLFVKHLNWAHGIAARHGKRMWIWDDYFMFFPEMLAQVPHDVVMCAWNYCPDLETTGLRNNFGCRLRRDVLREYETLGFDCLVCPWFDTDNIVRALDYAASRKCLGFLQTQWEMGNDYHGCFFPRVLATAALLRGERPSFGDDWLAAGVRAALPSLSADGVNAAVTLLADQSKMRLDPPSLQACRDAGQPVASVAAWKGALAVLRREAGHPGEGAVPTDPLGEAALLDDIVTRTETVIRLAEAKNAARCLTDPVRQAAASREAKAKLRSLLPRWHELSARRADEWRAWRPGESREIKPFEEQFVKFVREAQAIPDVAPESEWILEVDLVMADAYGVTRWRVEGLFGDTWKELAQGGWKPSVGAPAYFAKRLPLSLGSAPSRLRVSYRGYGAGELCHVSLYNRSMRLKPTAIVSVAGDVRDAANLLTDDFRPTRFGNPDCTAAILDPSKAESESAVVLCLAAPAAKGFRLADATVVYEDALVRRGSPKAEWGGEALESLTNALTLTTGTPVRMVPESKWTRTDSPAVYVGATKAAAAAGLDASALANLEFRMKVEPNRAFLLAKTGEASSFAMTEFLKRFADYRFLTIDGRNPCTVDPNRRAAVCDVTKRPAVYSVLNSFWGLHGANPSASRQRRRFFYRARAVTYQSEIESAYRDSRAPGGGCHTFYAYCPPKLFKEHPECFSMNAKGERFIGVNNGAQLCLSNPGTFDTVYASLVRFIESDRAKDPTNYPRVYDFSQLDCSNQLCLCPECLKTAARYDEKGGHADGGDAGLQLEFVNRLARKVRERYPDVFIRTFAYCSTDVPPKGIAAEENVIVRLCDMYSKSCHDLPLEHPFNAPRLAIFEGWRRLVRTLDVWDYTLYTGTPDVFVDAVAADARLMRRLGIDRYYVENHYDRQPFYELNSYVQGEMFFDPDQDVDALVAAWCRVYGKGAPKMKEAIDLLRKLERENPPANAGCWHGRVLPWKTAANWERFAALVREARAAETDPVCRGRMAAPLAQATRELVTLYRRAKGAEEKYARAKRDFVALSAEELAAAPIYGADLEKEKKADETFLALLDVKFDDLPAEIAGTAEDDLYFFEYHTAGLPAYRGDKVDDPLSPAGKSMRWKIAPKGKKPPFQGWQVSDGEKAVSFRFSPPADGKYHWHRVWTGHLGRNGKFGFDDSFSWSLKDVFTAADGAEVDPNWFEAWISVRLANRADSADPNEGLFIDRMVFRRRLPANTAPALPAIGAAGAAPLP